MVGDYYDGKYQFPMGKVKLAQSMINAQKSVYQFPMGKVK